MGGGRYKLIQPNRGGQYNVPSSLTLDTEPKSKNKREYRVLVTGMGAYPGGPGSRYGEDDNTSHLITKYLPSSLPIGHSSNPTGLPITILNQTSAPGKSVKAEYAYIRRFIQTLYDTYTNSNGHSPSSHDDSSAGPVDAILHLGMADGWEWYSIEERAFGEDHTCTWWGPLERQTGYFMIPDDAGRTVRDITEGEGRGMWKGKVPVGIASGVDVERLVGFVRRVVNSESESEGEGEGEVGSENENENESEKESESEKKGKSEYDRIIEAAIKRRKATAKAKTKPAGNTKQNVAITPHFEAGSYCCGFIYYESLATCLHRGLSTAVVFCHVPGWRDEASLQRGADVVCGIIGGLCEQIDKRDS